MKGPLWLLLPSLLTAQVTGDLLVEVSDPVQLPIQDAAVKIIGLETGYERTAFSGANGAALFRLLHPGPYLVRATAPGFSVFEAHTAVIVGTTTTFPVAMTVQASEQRVTVTVDEVVVVDDQGREAEAFPRGAEGVHAGGVEPAAAPHSRAGGENLERVGPRA